MLEMLTEFDEKLYEEGLREEAFEEGRKEGIKEGVEQELQNTEAERKRADAAEARIKELEAKLASVSGGGRL